MRAIINSTTQRGRRIWTAPQSGGGVSSIVSAHTRCRGRRNAMQWIPGEPTRDPATSAPRIAPSIADGFRVLCASQTVGLLGRQIKTPPKGGVNFGTPDRTRTCYPRLRRPVLYPDELRARGTFAVQLQARGVSMHASCMAGLCSA